MLILAAIAVILFIYLVNNYPRLLYTGINISDMGGNKIRLIKRINCMLVSLATGNTHTHTHTHTHTRTRTHYSPLF